MENLKHKTINAFLWSFLEVISQRGLQFIIGIVLARLLFPDQFGLIGMLAIFMAVARAFLDSGFGAALIQKQMISETDICSIFYFNIVMGLVGASVIYIVAPWIALFYKQPILTELARVLSLTIVINSFGLIQNTLLIKQINFKVQTQITLVAGVFSGITGITLALLGFGVWSLVAQQVSAALVSTVSLWFFSAWRPVLIFRFNALRELFGFGSRLLVSSVLNQIFDNIYYLVIGKLFTATDLGFFTRAKSLNDLPSQTLSEMAARVTFPVFSTLQNDPARLKKGLKKSLIILVMLNFPMMIGFALTARPLVHIILTDKWMPCVPYLQLLCIASLLFPLHLMNLNVLQALGRSDLFLRLEVLKKALIVIAIAVTWRWGISAMIYGMIVFSIIAFYLNSYYTGVLVKYPLAEQVRDLFPYLIVSVLMGIAVFGVGLLKYSSYWSMLLVQLTAGVAIYFSLCRLFRLRAFMDGLQSLYSRMPLPRAGSAR